MKPTFSENKPRFKTADERKFQAKSDRLQGQNKPRFEQREKFERHEKHSSFRKSSAVDAENLYPTEGRKVRGEGSVQISVKGNPWGNHGVKEKKTGALSPRAPEKIKKNRAEEMKVYGENACLAVFQQRPESIVRLWATVEGAKKLGELMSYLAKNQKAYHVVDRAEMERVTGTEHHGDVCLLIKKSPVFSLEGYLQVEKKQDCLVLLDGVNNAQNVGGVLRTCAYYGVKGVIVENAESMYSSAAARVAEGGLEFVKALDTKHKEIALVQLRQAGYQIVHLTRQKQVPSLAKTVLADKVVFVLSEIPTQDIAYPQDTMVQLSFSNPLNSGLNVAVSAGVLLAKWYADKII